MYYSSGYSSKSGGFLQCLANFCLRVWPLWRRLLWAAWHPGGAPEFGQDAVPHSNNLAGTLDHESCVYVGPVTCRFSFPLVCVCVCTFFTTVAEAYLFCSAHKAVVKAVKAVLEASVEKRKQGPTYMTVKSIVKLSGPPRSMECN